MWEISVLLILGSTHHIDGAWGKSGEWGRVYDNLSQICEAPVVVPISQ